jgi:hypothetical protein
LWTPLDSTTPGASSQPPPPPVPRAATAALRPQRRHATSLAAIRARRSIEAHHRPGSRPEPRSAGIRSAGDLRWPGRVPRPLQRGLNGPLSWGSAPCPPPRAARPRRAPVAVRVWTTRTRLPTAPQHPRPQPPGRTRATAPLARSSPAAHQAQVACLSMSRPSARACAPLDRPCRPERRPRSSASTHPVPPWLALSHDKLTSYLSDSIWTARVSFRRSTSSPATRRAPPATSRGLWSQA